jgi:hypothetical protein
VPFGTIWRSYQTKGRQQALSTIRDSRSVPGTE